MASFKYYLLGQTLKR